MESEKVCVVYLHSAAWFSSTPFLFHDSDEETTEWSEDPRERLRYAISEQFPTAYPYHRTVVTRVDAECNSAEDGRSEVEEGDHYFLTVDPVLVAQIDLIGECCLVGDVRMNQYMLLFSTGSSDREGADGACLDHYTFYQNPVTGRFESVERDNDDGPQYHSHTLPGLIDAILEDHPQFIPYQPDNVRHAIAEAMLGDLKNPGTI